MVEKVQVPVQVDEPVKQIQQQMDTHENNEGFMEVSPKNCIKLLNISLSTSNIIVQPSVNPYRVLNNLEYECYSNKVVSTTPAVRIPPIVIKEKVTNYQTLINQVRQTLTHNDFSCSYSQQYGIYVNAVSLL